MLGASPARTRAAGGILKLFQMDDDNDEDEDEELTQKIDMKQQELKIVFEPFRQSSQERDSEILWTMHAPGTIR